MDKEQLAALDLAATQNFQREMRYIVVKRKYMTAEQDIALMSLVHSFNLPDLECVVVENDWPECELVWCAIERRSSGRTGKLVLIDDGAVERCVKAMRALAEREGWIDHVHPDDQAEQDASFAQLTTAALAALGVK